MGNIKWKTYVPTLKFIVIVNVKITPNFNLTLWLKGEGIQKWQHSLCPFVEEAYVQVRMLHRFDAVVEYRSTILQPNISTLLTKHNLYHKNAFH